MGFHFRYGGSTAKRTLKCAGWAAMAKQLEEKNGKVDDSSVHADRGTMLHEACEILEKEGLEYDELLERGVSYNGIHLTEDLLNTKVIPAMESLEDVIEEYGLTTIRTEELITYSDLIGGTIDLTGESDDVLFFGDYKFGEGIMVYAEDNDQLLFYGWTKITTAKFKHPLSHYKKVVLAIIQPADRREEPLDVWVVTIEDLIAFGVRFLDAVDVAEESKPGENLCTGDHCQFCPASGLGDCPAKVNEANYNLEQLQKLDNDYPAGNTFELLEKSDKKNPKKGDFRSLDLTEALELIDKLEPWIKDVRSFACKQLELGAEVDGWKLVQKRATKHWVNVARITNYLKRKLGAAHAMESKVISPAKAISTAKTLDVKLRLKDHIDASSSGTTLARESDKRPAVMSQADAAKQLRLLDEGGEDEYT